MESQRNPFKREISVSIADLRDSVKRLAMEEMETDEGADQSPRPVPREPIVTVFSSAEDGFESKYEMLNEIGKGGFSVVYRCRG